MQSRILDPINKSHIKQSLKETGLKEGDIVLVHSSLSSIGWVEGGADSVIDALLETVGKTGTVMMPAFSFSIVKRESPVFDPEKVPSEMGKITEVFRQRKNTLRSIHLTHSVCALGAKAKTITCEHSITPCGKNSPFEKLVNFAGYVLLLGVDHNVSTIFHYVEESMKVPYVGFKDIPDALLKKTIGSPSPLKTKIHVPFSYDFNRMEEIFKEKGILKTGIIGNAIIRLISSKDLYEVTSEVLRKDNRFLFAGQDEKRLGIKTRISE